MDFTNKNLIEFIKNIVNFNNIYELIDSEKLNNKKGFIFERICDLLIKFGFTNEFPNDRFKHKIGNICKLKTLKNLNNYLLDSLVFSGKSGGASDISLYDTTNKEYIFISCKYINSTDIQNYDINKINGFCNSNEFKHIYKKYKIYLLVKDKTNLLNKIQNINNCNKYLLENINILDINDFNNYFINFINYIKNLQNNYDLDIFDFNKEFLIDNKQLINLKFHQQLIINKTLDLIINQQKEILWACKCRSGKTYMCGGLIYELSKINNINILIITPCPTETITQFTDELFYKYKNFNKFNIYNITNSQKIKKIKNTTNNIFIISKQLLQKFIKNKINKFCNINLIIIDETHYGGTTNLTKNIINAYSHDNTVKLYLTATYSKVINNYKIKSQNILYWDLYDELVCKNIANNIKSDINILYDKFSKKYIDPLININPENPKDFYTNTFNTYLNMPKLNVMSLMFEPNIFNTIKENIKDNSYGFSFECLFALNNENKFIYENEINSFLNLISGSDISKLNNTDCIYTRINKCKGKSRNIFTQLWFLPPNNINYISENLKELMLKDDILKKYEIICVNRTNKSLPKDIKTKILQIENLAINNKKKGLIILCGAMLNLGITLKKCDIVFLLHNCLSNDKIYQQMFRCMSEDINKTNGFVIDLNPCRVINLISNYLDNITDIKNKYKFVIDTKLINIDEDKFNCIENKNNIILNKMMEYWKYNPINSFDILIKNLQNQYIEIDKDNQQLINDFFYNSLKNNKLKIKISGDIINSGIIKTKKNLQEESDNEINDDEVEEKKEYNETEEIEVSFIDDVLPDIIKLSCILTIKDNNKTLIEILNCIKNNNELLNVFNTQSNIWWGKINLITFVKKILKTYYNKSNINDIVIQFKNELNEFLNEPIKLYELVNNFLQPKNIEKRKFGEVFTPINTINNMLNDLPNDIFNNINIKILDPACGSGNFIIEIYNKLMDTFKTLIPDIKKRKRHILTKNIYMSELNPKNVFITKLILDVNNEYTLNLHCGDSLNLDIYKEWKIKKFDLIIGNPPYNCEFNKGGALPLYNKFIEYYVNSTKLLSFIVPSRWFSGGKGLDKFRSMMLNRTDIQYIKHFDDASKIFKNVEIKGGVNYFLINNNYNGLCKYNDVNIQLNKYDIILQPKYYDIVNKMLEYPSLTSIYKASGYYKINTNDSRLKLNEFDNSIKCYVSQLKGNIKYINNNYVTQPLFFKVLTPRASYKAKSGFGNMFVSNDNEIYNQSYIAFQVNNLQEANSLLSYMKCKLPNFLLSLRKISQDISEKTISWIPLPPLNIIYNNELVYKYYKLTNNEINLIESTKLKSFIS